MAILPGRRLGPYEILSAIGAGGMGEVYKARDTRLDRIVAIKVLPPHLADRVELRERFDREAKAIASLNHPHICTLHDVGHQDEIEFLVMEYVEGETLAQRLLKGPLTIQQVMQNAIEISDALDKAHRKGITHRDLKPSNIMLTKSGTKLLDFGLAKLRQEADPAIPDSQLPTMKSAVTGQGAILGTLQYMAPEQVEAKEVDTRTDIFAFGVVVYEMATGKKAFEGKTSASVMAKILETEPPSMASLQPMTPPALDRVVKTCLAKESDKRWQTATDLHRELEWIAESDSQPDLTATSVTPHKSRVRLAWSAVFLIAALALGVRGFLVRQHQIEYRQVTFRKGYIPAARFAPGGQTIIYGAAWDHPPIKLYSSRADGTDVRILDLPPNELLAVSRSGELALLGRGHRLARAPLGGGAPRELLENVVAADWSPDGTQLAVVRIENGKCRLEYPIGKPLYDTIGYISDIRFSPQADSIAFMDHPISGDDRGSVALVDLKGNKRALTREWVGERGLAWSPDGSEVWFAATSTGEDRALYAVSRSSKQRLVLRIPGNVELDDISGDGRVLLTRLERRYEVSVSQIGGETRQLSWLQWMVATAVSRDGKFAVIGDWGSRETDYNVYLAKLDGSPAVLLGSGGGGGISPDNKWVTSILPTDTTKVLLLPTGVGETKTVTAPHFHYYSATWASDGRGLVVCASELDRPLRFWLQNIDGKAPRAVTPEGIDGLFLTINHSDFISSRDATGILRLYPIDGSEPRIVTGFSDPEQVIGGASQSDVLYVTPDISAIPLQVFKVNTRTGLRQPFINVSPTDPVGVVSLFPPIFTTDEKRYVNTQIRALSVLYVAAGLK